MADMDLVDRLAAHKIISAAPREELAWLAAHGTVLHLNIGDVLTPKGKTVAGLYVVLTGTVSMYVDRGNGLQKIAEWKGGDVTGVLPYSRVTSPPGDSMAEEPSEILMVARDQFRQMIVECSEVTTILVHNMLDRTRAFTSNAMHDEKMASLGKLSAGLAHELNNPASAIERGASLLARKLEDSEEAARCLGVARLDDSQFAAVDSVRRACTARRPSGVRSPIEEAEREEEISDWLADHKLDLALSEELTDTPVTRDALDEVARAVDGPALGAVLRWVGAGCAVRGLATEIQEAAVRITGLVGAIKGFTHMDQAPVKEPVELTQGLGNTVAVLKSKAKDKSATVSIQVEPELPRVLGFAGELNQIWLNLIDNALDALGPGGRVEVLASREGQQAVVRVLDNGCGIPEAIRARIFDPFFTTKAVGSGTGLGLDIVRRLLRHNDGDISVESRPGRTEFRVTLQLAALPLAARDGAARDGAGGKP